MDIYHSMGNQTLVFFSKCSELNDECVESYDLLVFISLANT